MEIRVLSSGVDTLHASMRGEVRPELWELGHEAQQQARGGDSEQVELGDTGQSFKVQGHGIRGYGLWMSSRDWELMLTQSEKFPAALAQLHSAYLHSMGVAPAVQLVEQTLRRAVMARAEAFTVSRIDLYADVQGWSLDLDHLHRFVSRSRVRRAFLDGYEVPAAGAGDQVFAMGRRVTGFVFGTGSSLLCRIYDKTKEIQRRNERWLVDLWGEPVAEEPVWRVEFQIRRPVLVDHGLRTVDEAIDGLQDLWRYCTHRWLTYRAPRPDARERRWPLDPVWEDMQAVRISPTELGVVRRRVEEADELQLVQGLGGYATSLAALKGWRGLDETLEHVGPILLRYLESRGRTWEAEVVRKRAKRMNVSGWIEDDLDVGEEEVA
jgi:hypothetical protein